MKIILGGPGTGKTKKLIQMSLETGAPIVCATDAEALKIARKSLEHFGLPCTICTVEEAKEYEFVLVRDAGDLLNRLLGTTIAGLTITEE